MHVAKSELIETLDKMRDLSVLVVGDVILDRYVWGDASRLSPEAPVPIVAVDSIEDRLGGAGNVVRNLRSLHAKVQLCGFVGDDHEGEIVLKLLENEGARSDGMLVDRDTPTSLKTRVVARRQQVVRIDRERKQGQGAALTGGFAAVVETQLEQSQLVIISDYGKGAISAPLMQKLGEAKKSGKIGMKSRPMVVDPHPESYQFYQGITVAKPNRREAEIASGVKIKTKENAVDAARVLMKRWNTDMMLITLGEDGLVILEKDNEKGIFLDTVAQEVFDVSGAGDTVTAVFGLALAVGANPTVAGDLANIAAGIVVSEVGTVPIDGDRLRRELERMSAVA